MSIKNLFTNFRNSSRNYAEYNTEKGFFQDVESIDNALALQIKADTYVPQLDYSKPRNFIKFGSAELFYEGALNKIVDYYPYDGSEAEKNTFYNELFEGEKYIFDNLYPRFNGYATFSPSGWGTRVGITDGYAEPTTKEYITFKGGPHSTSNTNALSTLTNNPENNKYQSANIYDETLYKTAGLPNDYGEGTRLSNLKSNFDTGVTVEFWLKATDYAAVTSLTSKQVIFDLWNNNDVAEDDYGRLRIELNNGGSSRFRVTAQSGTAATGVPVQAEIGTKTTTAFIQDWHHYAFRFYNNGSDFIVKMYVDGKIDDTNVYSGKNVGEITTSKMIARIGALAGAPSGSNAAAGSGKLSGSIDEFRFWKSDRNPREIAVNHFAAIGGGTNTDISNTTLGVYYKFNEGITGDTAIDSTVLDYSGRISNGTWTGYTAPSRNTGSAIVSASAAEYEYREPVVYSTHPEFVSLRTSLSFTGSAYDLNNNSAFLTYAPSWVIDQHEDETNKNLKIISHIVGTYFDKMYLLSNEMPKFKHASYTTASSSPPPFASHLPTSLGMYVPELFVDSTILEKFKNRSETTLHQSDLNNVKNSIYLNLYNNLTNIFKSKGTEKAIKNVMRCFYLDDELLKLKAYNVNATYELDNNFSQIIVDKNGINFNTPNNINANVYQKQESTNANSIGYLSGSNTDDPNLLGKLYGFTLETDVIFPNYFTRYDNVNRDFLSSSIFGVYGLDASDADNLTGEDTTFLTTDNANFQVCAVRDRKFSKNVYFKLTSSNNPHPIPTLTSSDFPTVYDNTRWNLSVRIQPNWEDKLYDEGPTYADKDYKIIFRGTNDVLGTTANVFELTGTISNTVAENFLKSHKRVFVGAEKTNLTGSTINKSDIIVLNCRAWAKSINNSDLLSHTYGSENSGIEKAIENISPLYEDKNIDLTNLKTLALDWTFNNVTGSDSTGKFTVIDASSGSALIRDNFGWLGKYSGYQHTGHGQGFSQSSTSVVDSIKLNSFKSIDPEQVVSSDMVNILSQDDQVLGNDQTVPSYLFTIEKNIYEAVSTEMLTFFAGVVDFNNLIGNPVNRYRERYKDIEKLREVFFEKVQNVTEAEKYFNYYKWFDDAVTTIVKQLLPASGDGLDEVLNVIESHALERHKYKTPFPTLESKNPTTSGVIYGVTEKSYPYAVGFSSLPRSPRDTTIRAKYWKDRAERTHPDISSGDSTIDTHREIYRKIIVSNPHLERMAPTLFGNSTTYTPDLYSARTFIQTKLYKVKKVKIYKGGSNFENGKNIHFAYSSVAPQGPVNTTSKRYIPLNVLLGFMTDLTKIKTNNDPKPHTIKTKRHLKVLSGREYEQGLGYYNLKSSMAFPFSLYETTVTSGHQAQLVDALSGTNLQITNLHNDVYGPDLEKPMQGPFTDKNVGGHQSRHIKLNTGSDTPATRPEAWRILVGSCTGSVPSGAIGLVGPDYPDPSTNLSGAAAYPYKPHKKAVYYRDMTAKRPVNIKNIRIVPGAEVIGNYTDTYEYIQTVGAFQNPRQFVENPPTLPANIFQKTANSFTSVRTFLDISPVREYNLDTERFNFVSDYNIGYLSNTANKSIIKSKFSAPGGIETMTPGYTDFRSDEFSVYNTLNYKNLSVLRPYQGPSGTLPKVDGAVNSAVGIRVNDIHHEDYGLRSHLARHTARFGRDSLHVPFDQTGASYDELPGFHKVHRNNLRRNKIVYGEELRDVPGHVSLLNEKSLYFRSDSAYGNTDDNILYLGHLTDEIGARAQIQFDAEWAETYGGTHKTVAYTWSGWIKFPDTSDSPRGDNGFQGIFDIGYNNDTDRAIQRLSISPDGRRAVFILGHTDGAPESPSNGTKQYLQGANVLPVIQDNEWHHFVFTFSGSHGTLNTDGAYIKLWVDGTETNISNGATTSNPFFPTSSLKQNFRNFGQSYEKPISFFGHLNTGGGTTPYEFTGFADEVSMYRKVLTSAEILQLYNGGSPMNLSASSAPATGSLLMWLRMGDDDQDNTSLTGSFPQLNSTSAQLRNVAPALDSAPGNTRFDFAYLTCTRDDSGAHILTAGTSSHNFLTGNQAPKYSYEVITGYTDDKVYDNFYVQHQIPRSSKQYAWITASIVNDNNWVGYAPRNFLTKVTVLGRTGNEYIPVYDFLSASEAGAVETGASPHLLYEPFEHSPGTLQQVSDLNLNIVDVISASSNTLGYPATTEIKEYLNYVQENSKAGSGGLIGVLGTDPRNQPYMFNNLMFKRGYQYGYTSWKQLRQAEHPIIRNQKANNKLRIIGQDGDPNNLVSYDLPAISNRGLPNMVHFESLSREKYTIKATHENEQIYFNTPQMDNVLNANIGRFSTPFQNVVSVGRSKGYRLRWVMTTQQIFPPIKNEFITRSYTKPGYNNKFWTDNRQDRNVINAILNTQTNAGVRIFNAPVGAHVSTNALGYYCSQSSWPLDAPTNFLDRTTAFDDTLDDAEAVFNSCSSGQLQNEYTYFLNLNMDNYSGSIVDQLTQGHLYRTIGPVYARPHDCEVPTSMVSPYGIRSPFPFQSSSTILPTEASGAFGVSVTLSSSELGGGAAAWDAPANAGYYQKNAAGDLEFVSRPSEPWFNSYNDYNFDLKLMAKGYSIVPEYRISENVSSYIRDAEKDNPFQPLELEIPHVPGADTQNDGSFYISYSNSEFLKDFLKIKTETLLNATEIKLSCKAAIRFNPYKGFYPAQRTVNLVEQFKDSYQQNFGGVLNNVPFAAGTGTVGPLVGGEGFNPATGSETSVVYRPLAQTIFAPGILYNSIKSGMAVDYPIITQPAKIAPKNFNDAYLRTNGTSNLSSSAWAMTFNPGLAVKDIVVNSSSFFDERLPFETMLEPVKHLAGKSFYDMESNPRTRLLPQATASFVANVDDSVYPQMARNFFGAVPSFFLKNSNFTSLKSNVKTDSFVFSGSEVYMMRVKMNRSTEGLRTYAYDTDGHGRAFTRADQPPPGNNNPKAVTVSAFLESNYTPNGGRPFQIGDAMMSGGFYALPQDPLYPNAQSATGSSGTPFRETFTMYSRPSAFGPSLAGRPFMNQIDIGVQDSATFTSSYDSFSGFNPAYTPPYYNGEAWADLIFRPKADKQYKIEDIIAETTAVYRRFDPGRIDSSDGLPVAQATRALIFDRLNPHKGPLAPYSGHAINETSMQLSASINLFGFEKIEFTEEDKFGNLQSARPGQSVGQRWVIRPKFETPMMNFANITGDEITYPNNFGGSQVAKGMWHQFGRQPRNKEGVFLSVEDIPRSWLRYHYDVIEYSSAYNKGETLTAGQGNTSTKIFQKVKSLADLVGFNKNEKVKLGQLKEKTTVREAVVAIPYIIEATTQTGMPPGEQASHNKKFISIPKQRFEAAMPDAIGSLTGDSLVAAGTSISKQLQKMQKYILPPQFDFINNPDTSIDPFVMYIFEFEYNLDRDDLSYIWQNLAPRDYKKVSFQHKSVGHVLLDNEILSERILEENQHLRWMIFKVKQKGQEDYWDYVDEQAQSSTKSSKYDNRQIVGSTDANQKDSNYKLRHNWPYDYMSFVEMIKLNVDIKYSDTIPAMKQSQSDLQQQQPQTPQIQAATPAMAQRQATNILFAEVSAVDIAKYTQPKAVATATVQRATASARRAMATAQIATATVQQRAATRTMRQAPSMGGAPDGMGFSVGQNFGGGNRGGGNY
tara:strand:+ start:45513 stop:56450 length:10938 start_codon:yes stop_codon:yes gene_type:complete